MTKRKAGNHAVAIKNVISTIATLTGVIKQLRGTLAKLRREEDQDSSQVHASGEEDAETWICPNLEKAGQKVIKFGHMKGATFAEAYENRKFRKWYLERHSSVFQSDDQKMFAQFCAEKRQFLESIRIIESPRSRK